MASRAFFVDKAHGDAMVCESVLCELLGVISMPLSLAGASSNSFKPESQVKSTCVSFPLFLTAQVPLADIFNHKASVVGDEYAVIEEEQSGSSSEESGEESEEDEEMVRLECPCVRVRVFVCALDCLLAVGACKSYFNQAGREGAQD